MNLVVQPDVGNYYHITMARLVKSHTFVATVQTKFLPNELVRQRRRPKL